MRNGPYTLIVAPKDYPGKRYRDRYSYEHLVVFWRNYKIIPGNGLEIHHKNGDHRDNRISNLQLVTSAEHRQIHGNQARKEKIKFLCGFCLKPHSMKPNNYRWKIKNNKYGKIFCSISCGAKYSHCRVAEKTGAYLLNTNK